MLNFGVAWGNTWEVAGGFSAWGLVRFLMGGPGGWAPGSAVPPLACQMVPLKVEDWTVLDDRAANGSRLCGRFAPLAGMTRG